MAPLLEKLEDRILLTAEPTATIEGPDTVELGQQDVAYKITFDNTSGSDTPDDVTDGDVGFTPFVNLLLPTSGGDGDGDGVAFDSATFLGQTIAVTQFTFDATGQIEHPVAVDVNGDPLIINGAEGDTLLVFELPFGSFSPEQVPVEIDLTLDYSDFANLEEVQQLQVTGGFALGGDPLDNPDVDPSIVGVTDVLDVTPDLFFVEKANDGPESETATGPNFPRTWTVTVDGADNQNFTDVVITDIVPLNIHYLGNLTVTNGGGAVVVDEPDVNAVVAPGDQNIEIQIANFTGGAPVTISFDYFIPDTFTAAPGAGLSDVLDPITGDDGRAVNDVSVTADWTPLDPDDDPVSLVSDATPEDDVLELKSIAVQKSVAIETDANVAGFSPGDTVRYTLDLQVSDFFTMGDIVLEDVLGDGLEFVAGSTRFAVTEADGDDIADTLFDAASIAATLDGVTGETTILFDLSSALVAAGAADGLLVGDLIDAVQEGATTATVTFLAVIEDTFDNPLGDEEVSQGDELVNDVTVSATVRDNADPGVAVGTEEDTSSAVIEIPFGQIQQKAVAFINGVAPAADLVISAGDVVTFSVIYVAPEGSYEDLRLDDFLPLPVFDATEITTFVDGPGAGTAPPAGEAHFGAATSAVYFAEGGVSPTLDVNVTSNAIAFDFGTFSVDPREEITIELLFSVTVEDAIFADGLLLTNQVSAQEANTDANGAVSTAIDQFVFGQPELTITKGVIASDQGAFDAGLGPVAFNAPGTVGQRWTAGDIIDSDGLAATPVDANLDGVDAGDVVSFAIVIENTGSAPNGVFDLRISDTLPAGFEVPGGGLNLDVRNGAGAALAFTDLGGGVFGTGIELNDGAGAGSLTAFDAASGENIVVITYDLVVADTTGPQESLDNTASIDQFTAFEGGADRVPADGLTDDASVTTLDPTVAKVLTTTSVGGDASTSLLVGEVATYTITVTLTEGTTEDVSVLDRIRFLSGVNDPTPGLLELLDAEIVSVGGNLTLENAFAVGDGPSVAPFDNQLGDGVNDELSFDFGDIFNTPDGVSDADDQIVIQVTALVRDVADTEAGDRLRNEATVFYEGESVRTLQDIRVVESNVSIDKTVSPDDVDGGDEVTFRVEISNDQLLVEGVDRSASAFDLVLDDILDDVDLTLTAGSVVLSGAASGAATIVTGNAAGDATILITLDELATGDNLIIEYRATLPDDVAFDATPTNTASLTFDSLPTDDDPNERDFAISDDATVDILTADFVKEIIDTSFAETAGADLAIGEEVTFQITATLPEGAGPIVITDTLPVSPGVLTFLSAEVTEVGADLTGALLAVGATATPVNGVITFDFGDIVNVPDGDTADETIVIEVRARLDDLAANAAGDALVNTAALFFGPDPDDVVRDTATIDVVEPAIAIDKVAPTGPVDAGDIVAYTLNIVNSGGAPAFDLTVADLLEDAGLVLVAGSVTPSDGTAAVVEVDDGFRVTVDVLDAGDTLQIVYQATVQDVVEFNGGVDNTAVVERFDSNPSDDGGDEARETVFDPNNPDADLFDSETVPTVGVTLDKTTAVADTSQTETDAGAFDPALVDLSVGEEVAYTLTIGVPEGQGVLVLTDELPDGLTALSAEVTAIAAGVTTANLTVGDDDVGSAAITLAADGASVVFDFGLTQSTGVDDPAGAGDVREIQVQITAIVADVFAATAGAELTNTATIQVFDPIDQGVELTDPANPTVATETVEVVEPVLVIEKVAPVAADPGDPVAYELTISHDALRSSGPAFDLVIADALDNPFLTFDSGSVVVAGAVGAVVAEVGTGFQVTIPLLEEGDVVTIQYTATLSAAAPDAESFPNEATVAFDSVPGDGGRTGSDTAEDAVATVPAVQKTLEATSFAETPGVDLGLGEVATFRLEVVLPEILSDAVTVTDTLPEGMTPLAARVISVGGQLSAAGSVADLAAPDIDIFGQTVQLFFDEVLNAVDGVLDGGDTIVIEIDAVLDGNAVRNFDGRTLTNDAQIRLVADGVELINEDSFDVTAVVPDVSLVKTSDVAAEVDAGDVIAFTVEIKNDGQGPAFDLDFRDLMADAGLSLVAGSVVSSDGTVATEVANGDGTLGFTLAIPELGVGETITVTYAGVVTDAAEFNGAVANTAEIASLDTNPLEPGDAGFEDEFTFTSDVDDPNDPLSDTVTATTVGVTLDKATSVADTDQAETGAGEFDDALVDLSIGEEVVYTLTIGVPEGSGFLLLTDVLPEGLTAVAAEVTAITAGVTTANLAVGDDDVGSGAITLAGDGLSVVFDFGLTTSTGVDDPAGAGDLRTIEVQVTAIVADVAAAVAGAQLTNIATLQVFDPDDQATELTDPNDPVAASETVEVVEPVLIIEKSADVAAQPGDFVEYVVTVAHDAVDSTGPAFDLVVADDLADAFLTLATGSIVVEGVNGAVVTEVGDGFTVAIPVLEEGEIAIIRYTALLDAGAPEAASFPNTATVDFSSDPDGDGRAGAETATEEVATVPALEKSLAASSFAETEGDELGLGEVATFRLEVALPEVLSDIVTVTDDFPPGLTPLAVRVVAVGGQLSGVGAVADLAAPEVTIAGQSVTVFFDSVNNVADGLLDDGDTIVIEIDAVLDADAAANADGDVLTNAAEVTLEVGGTPLDNDDTFAVTAVQPDLAVTKTASPATDVDAGDIVTFTVEIANSGDGPAYDLDFQDRLADAGLSLVSGSVVSTDGSTAVEAANGDGTLGFTMAIPVLDDGATVTVTYAAVVTDAAEFNGAVDNVAQIVSFDTNPLEPGDAGFVDEVTVVSDIDDADDPLIGRANVPTVAVTLDKTTVAGDTDQTETGAGEFDPALVDVSVGETVVYTFAIGVPEGSGVLVLTDTAPDGLTVIAAEVTAIGAGVSTANLSVGDDDLGSASITLADDGTSVVFDFGLTISTGVADPAGAGDLRVIEVQVSAIVDDVAAAAAGAQLANTGVIQVFDPDDGTELTDPNAPTTASETVEVVEPALIVEKSAPVAAKPGDTVAFEVTVFHDAAASTGPAFDLLVADILDNPFLTFDAGTVDVSGVAGAVVTEVDGGFEVTIPVLEEGEAAVIRYTATLAADAPSAEAFANTATVDFDSAPGDGGRAQTEQATDEVSTVPGVAKTIDRSSFAETDGADLGLGETGTFRLDVLLPEVLSEAVVVTDTLPDGMTFLAARVVAVGGQLAGVGAVADLTAPVVTIAGQTITLAFDNVDNTPDGVLDAGDVITIEIDAILTADPVQNPNGGVLTNAANISLTAGGLDLTADDTLDVTSVIPDLAVTKSVASDDVVDEGDIVTYTVEIANSGDGPAFDLAFEDLMADPRLSLVSGSVVASDGSVAVEAANGDGTLGFTLALPVLDDGATLTITYSALVVDVTEFDTPIENTARIVSFDTNPDEPGDAGFTEEFTIESDVNDPDDPLIDTAVVTSDTPDFTKTVLTTSVAGTGSAEFDPANVDLVAGETAVYRFEIVMPEGSDNLTITDQFPTGGAFSIQDIIVTAGASISGAGLDDPTIAFVDSNGDGLADRLTIDLGAVDNAADNVQDAGDVITVDVLARVDDNPRNQAGDVYVNVATLTGDAFTATDTETVDIVGPDVSVAKAADDAQVVDGDTVTFTITVSNDADATAAAHNLRVTDLIPDGLTLLGDAEVSNQGLATVLEGDAEDDDAVIVEIDVLRPGQTVEITYTVSVDEAVGAIRNEITLTGGTVPNDPDLPGNFPATNAFLGGPGRPIGVGAFADIFAGPATLPGSFERFAFENLRFSPIDDAQFERVVRIDPIFSGSAEYGSGLSLTIFDALGGFIGTRQVMADAGGEWIAHFPLIETGDSADRDIDAFYRETRLFADPTGFLAQEGESIFDLSLDERLVQIGTALGEDQFQIRLDDTASAIGDDSGATFNNRLFYAPASQNELFVLPERLDVSEVFEEASGLTVERLLANSRNPLAFGLNRFNAEFLTNSGVPSGL